jgi:hypothetical protein
VTRGQRRMVYAMLLFWAGMMCVVYDDHWACVKSADRLIAWMPGCKSHKEGCRLDSCYGRPVITMVRREAGR